MKSQPPSAKKRFWCISVSFSLLVTSDFFPILHTKKCMCIFFCSIQEYPIEDHSLFVCLFVCLVCLFVVCWWDGGGGTLAVGIASTCNRYLDNVIAKI
jgi:hypothetical protein